MSDNARMTVKIDPEVKEQFKIIALRKKKTMSDIIEAEVKKYIEANQEYL